MTTDTALIDPKKLDEDKGAPSATRRAMYANIGSYVVLAFFVVAFIGPLLMLLLTSLKSLPEFFKNPTGLPESLEFSNFTEAWSLASFP